MVKINALKGVSENVQQKVLTRHERRRCGGMMTESPGQECVIDYSIKLDLSTASQSRDRCTLLPSLTSLKRVTGAEVQDLQDVLPNVGVKIKVDKDDLWDWDEDGTNLEEGDSVSGQEVPTRTKTDPSLEQDLSSSSSPSIIKPESGLQILNRIKREPNELVTSASSNLHPTECATETCGLGKHGGWTVFKSKESDAHDACSSDLGTDKKVGLLTIAVDDPPHPMLVAEKVVKLKVMKDAACSSDIGIDKKCSEFSAEPFVSATAQQNSTQLTELNNGRAGSPKDGCVVKSIDTPSKPLIRKVPEKIPKTFSCFECDKMFSKPSLLTQHQRLHMVEKPFKCDECRKEFKYKQSLKEHKLTHTGERPFLCDQCPRRFLRSFHLVEHKRSHTGERPFVCDQCQKAFKESGGLVRHKRIHTGEKPFECDDCGKCFKEIGALSNHQRIHTGERPFKCDLCDKAFKQSGALTRHKLRIHTREPACKVRQTS